MQGESIPFFNRSSLQYFVCTFIYLAVEKVKGECRDTLQHKKGQIHIQNPDWIIGWCWIYCLVEGVGGRDDRCECVTTFLLNIHLYIYISEKGFRRQYHALNLLSYLYVSYLIESFLIIMLPYLSCIMYVFIWTPFHLCFQICLHKSLQYSSTVFKSLFVSAVMSMNQLI